MTIETGDEVTLEYTGRLDDGTVFDTSHESVAEEAGLAGDQPDREYTPVTVDVGAGELIEGLDEALLEMEEGEQSTVEIPPEKAYGEPTDEQVVEYERAVFEEALGTDQIEAGMHVESREGGVGRVVAVDDESVQVDFNHELAGEPLEFEVEIVEVR